MERIKKTVTTLMPSMNFDAVGVGVIDFKQGSFEVLEVEHSESGVRINEKPVYYYDLASLTKPLTNSLGYFLSPEAYDELTMLCLNHRSGLTSWGRLSRIDWREKILSYPVTESPTVYSDISALRVLLELQKKGVDLKNECGSVWDKEMVYWLDLPPGVPTLQNGYWDGQPNFGKVHDPNAWVISEFVTHAGLFSTVQGLCRTLLNYQRRTDFIGKVKADCAGHTHRFSFGWDRVEDPEKTLAGSGCGKYTFGHLGFTGTSIWIDPDKHVGHVILSNATKNYWFEKQYINEMRRAIGELVWKNS